MTQISNINQGIIDLQVRIRDIYTHTKRTMFKDNTLIAITGRIITASITILGIASLLVNANTKSRAELTMANIVSPQSITPTKMQLN